MVCPIRVGCTALVAFICALSLYYAYNPKKDEHELTEEEAERHAANELRSGTDGLMTRLMVDVGVRLKYYRHFVIFLLIVFHVELITQGAICRYLFVNNKKLAALEGVQMSENYTYGHSYLSPILVSMIES